VKHWYGRGAAAWLLWPVSLLFRIAVAVRRILYKLRLLPSVHPGIPVIVVGNLTAGGSGKTPLVIWIAEYLKRKGWTPAVVSRARYVRHKIRPFLATNDEFRIRVTPGGDPEDPAPVYVVLRARGGTEMLPEKEQETG